jgi:hypothetical protein
MNAARKMDTLKGMIIQKRDFDGQKKDLSDSIRINGEQIENTIMDDGEVEACKKLLQQNYVMMTSRKELQGKIKMIAEEMEKIIMGDAEYDGQMDLYDKIDMVEAAE